MNNKILILLILLATVTISGCVNSSVNNINLIIPKLSQNIVDGDNNYNEAVKYVNNQDYENADKKIKTATASFNEGENKILAIDEYISEVNDTLYLKYINLVKEEFNLKRNATSNLQLAIEFFKTNNISEANNCIDKANSFMNQGESIQIQRDYLAKSNPDKFE